MATDPAQLIDEAADVVRDALDELVKGLRETIVTLQARVETAEGERDEAKEQLDAYDEEHAEALAERDEVLEVVRYWLHDVLHLGKAASAPRRLLQLVERALYG